MKSNTENHINQAYESEGVSPLTLQSSVLVVTTRRSL
ncbi:hypothetical protein FHS04_001246 [Mesoflavibacter sabulilitoris]|nr:hypothetical protein [Mesoflavibacter zeaxanthinifaciens subsp. sabulilitoris]